MSTKTIRRLGPYSRTLHRGAIGASIDGRSATGRLIRDMERQLMEHVGGSPSITQRLLIDRIIKIRLRLDAFDEKLASGNWTDHDGRTFGGLQSSFRLALAQLGLTAAPPPAPTLADVLAQMAHQRPASAAPAAAPTPPQHDTAALPDGHQRAALATGGAD